MSRVRDVRQVSKLELEIIETHVRHGAAAQLAVDQLLEVCSCSHVRAAHANGRCCELACDCGAFAKAVR